MARYVSPVNPAIFAHLTFVLMAIGLFFTAWFFVYEVTSTKFTRDPKKELLIKFTVLQILTNLTLSPIFHNVAKILREITSMKKIDGFLCDRIEHFFKETTDLDFNGILPKGKYDHCVWTYWICIADQDFCKGHEFFQWFLREIKGMYEIPEIRDITIDFSRNICHNVVWFDAKNL